ncbi:MAG: hypothetical protein QOE37_289 [Microbacteriaceae bacterium]|nr:hypothetical protein [Microbacteriaceae bacterium]
MKALFRTLLATGLLSRAGGAALIAQVLTLASLVAPIAFRLTDQLPTVVLAAAIASIVGYPATLGAIVRIPPLGSTAAGSTALRRSLVALALVCVLGVAVALVLGLETAAGSVALQSAAVLAGQGLFMLAQARAIGALEFAAVARLRLAYGVMSLAFTVAVCLVLPSALFLSLAAAAAMAIAAGVELAVHGRRPARAAEEQAVAVRESLPAYVRSGLTVGLSLGFGNLATQAPALVLPALGALAPAWSTVTRIGNGFLTVGGNIVGPAVGIRFSAALQRRDAAGLRASLPFALAVSGALAAGSLVVLLATSALEYDPFASPLGGVAALTVGVVGFWGTQVLLAPIGNVLPMIPGGSGYRVAYDTARVVSLLLPIAVLRGGWLLIWVGIASAICNLLFVAALRRVVLRYRPAEEPAAPGNAAPAPAARRASLARSAPTGGVQSPVAVIAFDQGDLIGGR